MSFEVFLFMAWICKNGTAPTRPLIFFLYYNFTSLRESSSVKLIFDIK